VEVPDADRIHTQARGERIHQQTSPGRYRAMTQADAQAAAREIVRADDLVWVVVGDRAAIEKDLRELNLAPIEVWDVNGRPVSAQQP